MPSFKRTHCYSPRPIRFAGVIGHDDWRIKRYEITLDGEPLDAAAYTEGLRCALAALPIPAQTEHRPGVGFAICHQGRGWHYLVLNWWDNENEHFNRVFVKPREGIVDWRPASSGESACVWDLEVIWFERQAYVCHVLAPQAGPNLESYLAQQFRVG